MLILLGLMVNRNLNSFPTMSYAINFDGYNSFILDEYKKEEEEEYIVKYDLGPWLCDVMGIVSDMGGLPPVGSYEFNQ